MISLNTMRAVSVSEDRAHRVFEVSGGEFGGKLMFTREFGRTVRGALVEALTGLPKGGVLYIDTRGVEIMDYSFADEAIGTLISRVAGGEYGERHLVLVEGERDLLENIEASLRQRNLAMIRIAAPGGEPIIIGTLEDHLLETLEAVRKAGPITTADLAARLGLAHTACNNRATNLAQRGLIARRKEAGGKRYVYERIV